MNNIINRVEELQALGRAFDGPGAALFVLYGRRRLGKTTLLRHFAAGRRGTYHVADRAAEPDAMRLLAGSMARGLGEPTLATAAFPDWYALFAAYDRLRPPGRSYLILDEFQYLCEVQPAFASMLQKWWDEHWSHQDLMLVLCGSVLSMMYRETLSRASPLYGRRTGQWLLRPLRFTHTAEFFPNLPARARIEMWALTGGVPRYAELAAPCASFAEALDRLVLRQDGPLYSEARFLLQDEVTVANVYWSLLHAIGCGVNRISEIAARLGVPANQLTRYLRALQDLGLVRREVPVTESDVVKSKRGLYRIDDGFLRLWFGTVAPYESLLEFGRIAEAHRQMQPRLAAHQAWAFEEVCRQYVEDRAADWAAVRVGRYWDRTAELDIVAVDERYQPRLAAECKWSTRPVGPDVLEALRDKTRRLWPQQERNLRLLLFSAAGFTPALRTAAAGSGALLVDTDELLQKSKKE